MITTPRAHNTARELEAYDLCALLTATMAAHPVVVLRADVREA